MLQSHIDCRLCPIVRLAMVVACFVIAVSCPTLLHGEDYKAAILQAWKAREDRAGDAVITVEMNSLIPRGALNGRRTHDPAHGDLPRDDTYAKRRVTLYVSGALKRLEYHGETHHLDEQALVPRNGILVVQKGGEVRELVEYRHNERTPLQGTIKDSAVQLEVPSSWPLFYFCRSPFSQLDDYSVVKLRSNGDDRETIELASSDGSRMLVVDPKRNYSVLHYRRETNRNGEPGNRTQLDIEYTFEKNIGWVPKSWVTTRYKRGRLARRCECQVDSFCRGVSLTPGLFTLSFPPGAHVWDMLDPDEHVRYVYLESGQRKEHSRVKISKPRTR